MCPQVFIIYNVLPGPRRAPGHGTCGGGVVIFHRFQAEKGMPKSRPKKSREAKKRRFCLADNRFHDVKTGRRACLGGVLAPPSRPDRVAKAQSSRRDKIAIALRKDSHRETMICQYFTRCWLSAVCLMARFCRFSALRPGLGGGWHSRAGIFSRKIISCFNDISYICKQILRIWTKQNCLPSAPRD